LIDVASGRDESHAAGYDAIDRRVFRERAFDQPFDRLLGGDDTPS
jgi:hypothetical protein